MCPRESTRRSEYAQKPICLGMISVAADEYASFVVERYLGETDLLWIDTYYRPHLYRPIRTTDNTCSHVLLAPAPQRAAEPLVAVM